MPKFVPYEGNLSPNDKLAQAKFIARNKLVGPETLVFTNEGDLYAGLQNGYVVRVNMTDESITKVVRTGNEIDDSKCGQIYLSHEIF
jgi:hypothetical protein